MPTIQLQDIGEGKVACTPQGYLGGDLWSSYQNATKAGGSRYDKDRRAQIVHLKGLGTVLDALQQAGFEVVVDPSLKATLQAQVAQARDARGKASARMEKVNAELAKRNLFLFPFQEDGIERQATLDRMLNADEMGLGKTIQTLTSLPDILPEGQDEPADGEVGCFGVVVICPAVAKGVWAREGAKWRPDFKYTILNGRGSFRWPKRGEVIITNYDLLPENANTFGPTCPKYMVLVADECQAMKSAKAQRTVRWRVLAGAVAAGKGKVWQTTGTYLLNRPQELWTIFQNGGLIQETFGTWNRFVDLFDGSPGPWGGWEWGPDRNEEEIGRIISKVVIRRMREDVLPDLPQKIRQNIYLEPTAEARKALKNLAAELESSGLDFESAFDIAKKTGKVQFEDFSHAFQQLAVAKIPALIELIEQEEEAGQPLVVVCSYKAPVELLGKRKGWAIITGDTPAHKRTEIEEAFQRGELKGLAMTIKAGGVAITLTRSHKMIFVSREWTPALNWQAEDRICRIGQDSKNGCIYIFLLWDHPLERRMSDLLGWKEDLLEGTVQAGVRHTKREGMEQRDEQLERLTATLQVQEPAEQQAKAIATQGFTLRLPPAPGSITFREAASELERWAHQGVLRLASLDPDHAGELNGVGFNRLDGDLGHKFAGRLMSGDGLSDKQWSFLVKMLRKYRRQIGTPPDALANEAKTDVDQEAKQRELEEKIAALQLSLDRMEGKEI